MSPSDRPTSKVSRRALLQAAVGTAALIALPTLAAARSRSAATASVTQPLAQLGYWLGGAAASPANVRAGWLPACASSLRHSCDAVLDEELVDARRVAGSAGLFRVRIVALANTGRADPVRLLAVYGDARHEMWSAWRGGCSSPVATRMTSVDGAPLTLALRDADAVVRDVRLPARAGAYVLPLAGSVSWRRVALAASDTSRPLARELVRRGDGARITAPYLLLAVERFA